MAACDEQGIEGVAFEFGQHEGGARPAGPTDQKKQTIAPEEVPERANGGAQPAAEEEPYKPRQKEFVLRAPSYRKMFTATLVSTLYITAGLFLLGLGARIDGTAGRILLRNLAWLPLFHVPTQQIGIMALRAFCLYSVEPGESVLSCFWSTWNPWSLGRCAQSRGMRPARGIAVAVTTNVVWLGLIVTLTSVPIGEPYGFMGYVLTYGVGHILIIALGNVIIMSLMPPEDKMYGLESGPPSFGLAMVGFFVVVSGLAIGQRYLGAWFGALMPFFLSAYESKGTSGIGAFFIQHFVLKGERVHSIYAGTKQEILPSTIIALVHTMAQTARLTIFLAEVTNDPESRGWVVSLGVTFAMGILSRTEWLAKMFFVAIGKRKGLDNFQRLLLKTRYQGGYPALAVALAFGVARAALGNSFVPNSSVTWVLIGVIGENILEDAVVMAMTAAKIVPRWPVEKASEAVLEKRATKRLSGRSSVRSSGSNTSTEVQATPVEVTAEQRAMPVEDSFEPGDRSAATFGSQERREASVNSQTFSSADLDDAKHSEYLAHDLKTNLSMDFGELPLWATFTTVTVAQFHMALFVIIFGGGVNYTLGFCQTPGHTGVDRGVVWWPLMDNEDPCGGI